MKVKCLLIKREPEMKPEFGFGYDLSHIENVGDDEFQLLLSEHIHSQEPYSHVLVDVEISDDAIAKAFETPVMIGMIRATNPRDGDRENG